MPAAAELFWTSWLNWWNAVMLFLSSATLTGINVCRCISACDWRLCWVCSLHQSDISKIIRRRVCNNGRWVRKGNDRYAHLTVLNVLPRLIYTPLTCYNFDTHGSNAKIFVFICCFNSFSNEVVCCVVQSPASLAGASGRWLTGCDIDSVQNLLKSKWSGARFKSVTSEFQEQMKRPFIQVRFYPLLNNGNVLVAVLQ